MVGGLAFGATDARVVGITAGVFIGLVAGPLVGLFGGAVGITTGTLTSVTAGVVTAILTGVLVDQVGKAALSPDGRLYAAVALGPLTGVFVALSGVADGVVAAAVGDLTVRAVGSLGIGLAAGLSIGLTAVAVLGAFGRLDAPPADSTDGLDELDLDALTDTDVVTMMIDEFRRFSPGGAEALIDERDAFIARRLVALRDAGHDVVAVVGAGHRAGIERYLEAPASLPPESALVGTEGSRGVPWTRLVGYGITVAFVGFFVLLAMAGVRNGFLLRLFGAWFLINGVFAFGFAKLAGARWSSAGVGGAVAWMTSINPLLAPGWFTGYVELRHLTVNVADIERLNRLLSDESRSPLDLVSRMLEVPLFRLIVVVAMTNVGSIVASLLFAVYVLPAMFGAEVGSVDEVTRLMLRGAQNSVDLLQGLVG
jgi:pheromone shutdown protein TraB